MHWYRWDDEDLIVTLHVQPGAKRSAIAGLHGGALKLRVCAPPTDGRANRAVLELLARHFGVSRSRMHIERGRTSRRKTVRVAGPARAATTELLARLDTQKD